jgi:DNA repair photolyase
MHETLTAHAETPAFFVSDAVHPIKKHTNTECCPLIYEVIPAHGCEFGCVYCNVYSLMKKKTHYPVTVFPNYPAQLREHIESQKEDLNGRTPVYYFSPKTDIFQSALVETGITQQLLEVMVEKNVEFILVTKGKVPNDRIFELLEEAKPKGRVLISQGMKNEHHARVLEPKAATMEERFEFTSRCTAHGVPVMGVIEPILPLKDLSFVYQTMDEFMRRGVDHFAVDFARISLACLDDMIEKLPELEELREVYCDKEAVGQTFETGPYYREHVERYAPSKEYMTKAFTEMNDYITQRTGTISICNYFHIPGINVGAYKRGYLCFGIYDPKRAEGFFAKEQTENLVQLGAVSGSN